LGVFLERVVFFIDGFNLYHSLDEKQSYHKYKWLNLRKLAECFVRPSDEINKIYYFTALALWNPRKVNKHKKLIKALELEGVKPVYGKFKMRDKKCPNCKTIFKKPEEKQTDVNIAIHLFKSALENEYDKAIIISGDSDLIPSVGAIKTSFPAKKIGVVIPINRRAKELIDICDFHTKLKEKHLASCIFPLEIDIGNSRKLSCPPN
jgi:uncharacterized LabA/DUF88 family protein